MSVVKTCSLAGNPNSSGISIEPRPMMKHSTAADSRAGRETPSVTRKNTDSGDAPLMRAACS